MMTRQKMMRQNNTPRKTASAHSKRPQSNPKSKRNPKRKVNLSHNRVGRKVAVPPRVINKADKVADKVVDKTADKTAGNHYKLQKILALMSGKSRRQAEEWIVAGRVRINGKIATIGARTKLSARITLDGRQLHAPKVSTKLLCYHKPAGKIVERGATDSVFDDLPNSQQSRWINIGRLDVNSEGLLLFSNDGDLAQQLAHPRYAAEREYIVRVDGELSAEQIQQVKSGLFLDKRQLRPLLFAVHKKREGRNQWYKIVLSEGRESDSAAVICTF